MSGNFWVLLIGTFCGGVYAAWHQSFRFAAAETASDAYRPKVVSWVFAVVIQRHNGPRSNRRAAPTLLRIAPGDWSGREKDRCRGTGFHESGTATPTDRFNFSG
jgi:hypothetical protein